MTDTLYRLAPASMYPLEGDAVLICFEADGSKEIMTRKEAELLAACQDFRTLEGHARHAAAIGAGQDVATLRESLAQLARASRLRACDDFLAPDVAGIPQAGPDDKLSWLVVPTCNRVASLVRGLESYLTNARAHGHALEILVADSAIDPEETCRLALRGVAASSGTRIAYAGYEQNARDSERIAHLGQIPLEVVKFALLGAGWAGENIGANRNVALLRTSGARVLSVDDDTVCRTLRAPIDPRGALALRGDVDVPEVWSYPDREAVLAAARSGDIDVVGEHDTCLGWRLPALVQQYKRTGHGVAFEDACGHMLRSLLGGTGSIVATINGVAGDSGMYSGELLALHESPDTRRRLLNSEASYRLMTASREVIRQASTPSVSHGGHFMSTCVGLDNRELLPPFLPVYRSEDRVFGATVMACFENAFFAHLPWSLLHAPSGTRTYVPDPWSTVRVSDVLIALITSWCAGPQPRTPAERLRALGAELQDISRLPSADLQALVRIAVEAQLFEAIRHKELMLRRHDGQPHYWANEVRRQMYVAAEALRDPRYMLPVELVDHYGDEEAPARLRALLHDVGQLFEWWPSIVETAKHVSRAHGELCELLAV
jgi:hypothetical protein